MTDWTKLQDAYGSAREIPLLLDQLSPDPNAEVWGELWSRICHQGSVYSASFAAIPRLTQAAAVWPPSARSMVLSLAGAIFAGDDQRSEFADMRTRYQDQLTQLRILAAETLASPALAQADFLYVQQAALAFEDIRSWATELDRLNGGEFEASCPACGTQLHVAIGDYGFFTSEEDYAFNSDVKRERLRPANPASLKPLARRLYDAALSAGHTELASSICYLFGDGTCVNCQQHFSVSERIESEFAAT
jgi:hypothetical protein